MQRLLTPVTALASVAAVVAGQEPEDWPAGRLGEYVTEHTALASPGDAAWFQGELWLSERDAHRVVRIDATGQRHEYGQRGPEPGSFVQPGGLAASDTRLWVADTGNHRVQSLGEAGQSIESVGTRGSGLGELLLPEGLDADAGHLVVADSGNDRLMVWSLPDLQLVGALDWSGAEPAGLLQPTDVAIAPDGDSVFVVDSGHHRVVRIAWSGAPLDSWGGFGPHTGLFARPHGIDVHGQRVYVAELENHRVQVFDLDGASVYEWGLHAVRPREGEGKLHYPRAVALDESGQRAAVVEGLVDRVQLFGPAEGDPAIYMADPAVFGAGSPAHYGPAISASAGLLLQVEPERQGILLEDLRQDIPIEIGSFGGYGLALTQFLDARAMWIGRDASSGEWRALVSDAGRGRIHEYRLLYSEDEELRYDPARAQFLRALHVNERLAHFDALPTGGVAVGPIARAESGELYLVDQRAGRVQVFDPALRPTRVLGEQHGIQHASAIMLDEQRERLWIADEVGARVLALSLASDDAGAQELSDDLVRPSGLALAEDGRLYVSDAASHTISVYNPEGERLARFGSKGLGAGELYKPRGLAIDGAGRLIVSDHGNHRGVIYSADGEFALAYGPRLYVRPTRDG